jgi:hypothetical protein
MTVVRLGGLFAMKRITISIGGALVILLCAAQITAAANPIRLGNNVVAWPLAKAGPTIITYTMLTGPFSLAATRRTLSSDNCRSMTAFSEIVSRSDAISVAAARHELRAAFSAWEGIANVLFKEVADVGKANIIVGASVAHHGRAFANLSYAGHYDARRSEEAGSGNALGASRPARPARSVQATREGKPVDIEQAYVCLNPGLRWKIGFDGDLDVYDLRYTFVHEIGHAIGLDHPGKSGAVMGYRYDERVRGFQPSDRAAVQLLYGPRRSVLVPAGSQKRSRE